MFYSVDRIKGLLAPLGPAQGGFVFRGAWNADTNTPTLTSGVGTQGDVWIVSVAGATVLDGNTDWEIGDFAVFGPLLWSKVDNSERTTYDVTLLPTGLNIVAAANINAVNYSQSGASTQLKLDNAEVHPIGTRFDCVRMAADTFSIQGDTLVDINGVLGGSFSLKQQYSRGTLVKIGNPHTWQLSFWRNLSETDTLQHAYDNGTGQIILEVGGGKPFTVNDVEINDVGPHVLKVGSTVGFLNITTMTTAERDAVLGVGPGSINFNTDTQKLEYRTATAWINVDNDDTEFRLIQLATGLTNVAATNLDALNFNQAGASSQLKLTNAETFPVGSKLQVARMAADAFSVDGDTLVDINGITSGSFSLNQQYSRGTLVKIANPHVWQLSFWRNPNETDDLQHAYDNGNGQIILEVGGGKPLSINDVEINDVGPHVLKVGSTVGFLNITTMTTAERDAVADVGSGSVNFNTDTQKLEYRTATAWVNVDTDDTELRLVQLATGLTNVAATNLDALNFNQAGASSQLKLTNAETFPVGSKLQVARMAADAFSVDGDTLVDINGVTSGSFALNQQYSRGTLVKIANPHVWQLSFWRNPNETDDLQNAYDNGTGQIILDAGGGKPFTVNDVEINNVGPHVLKVGSTVGFLNITTMTTAERDAVADVGSGSVNFNTDTQKLEYRTATAWVNIDFDALSPTTTKGDIIANNGSTNDRLPAPTVDDNILVTAPAEPYGIAWSTIQNLKLVKQLLVKTDTTTVTNTTTETTVMGTYQGTNVVLNNDVGVGSNYTVHLSGCFSNNGPSENMQTRVYFNSVVIADTGLISAPVIVGLQFMEIELEITVRGTGATATIISTGHLTLKDSSPNGIYFYNMGLTSTTVDPTVSNVIDITHQWANMLAANQFVVDGMWIERIR